MGFEPKKLGLCTIAEQLGQSQGLLLAYGAVAQLALGIATLALTGWNGGRPPELAMVLTATVHQTIGAFLLALSIYIAVWIYRMLPLPGKRG